MEEKVETANLTGALKSQSSFEGIGNDKNNPKRASAVRFADQADNDLNTQPSRLSGGGVTISEEDETESKSRSKLQKTGGITVDSDSSEDEGKIERQLMGGEEQQESAAVLQKHESEQSLTNLMNSKSELNTTNNEGGGENEEVLLEISGELYEQKLRVDDRLFLSRLAEQGGRDEDMAEFIIDMIRAKDNHMQRKSLKSQPYAADYSKAERNTITVAIKKAIGGKRTAIRLVESVLENPKYAKHRQSLHTYKQKI